MNIEKDVDDLIIEMAEKFRVDANLIRAITWKESQGQTWKNRFEPAMKDTQLWHPDVYSKKLFISRPTEEANQKNSWGLMQVMGATARWQGFESDLPMLLLPQIGLFYGTKYLRYLFDRLGDEDHVVAAYNAGPGVHKTSGGMWDNQKTYVDVVYSYLRDLRKLN